jgi:type IV secretion system protein VirD4
MIDPDRELWLINRRHEELRRQAARDGLARRLRRGRPGRAAILLDRVARLLGWSPRPADSSRSPGGWLVLPLLSSAPSLAQLDRRVVELLVTILIVGVVVLAVRIFKRGPYRLRRRVPRRLRMPARLTWIERPFLGWTRTWTALDGWAIGGPTDTVGVIGPHDSGKTHGLLVPQALLWGGALVSTSTKPDVLRATAGRRLARAHALGGRVHVYAPTTPPGELVEGLRPMRWSPLSGCIDPQVVSLRVGSLVHATHVGRGVEDSTHWRAGAARILRPYFFAAAHHAVRPGDLSVVRDWLARREVDEPLEILEAMASFSGDQWAAELRGVAGTPPREQGSFYSAAETALAATSNPHVLRSCTGTDMDAAEFLTTCSTLFIVSPSEHQAAVAPLIAALIESIVATAYELHRAGRLHHRVLLSLDELANIAPLPMLGSIASQGTSQGVSMTWGAQSMAQLRERYGPDGAAAIWSETTAKLVFGGLSDQGVLQELSTLLGEHRVTMRGTSTASWSGERHRTRTRIYRPRVTPAELAQLRPGWVLLLHRNAQAWALRVRIAPASRTFRAGLLPWPVHRPATESPSAVHATKEA